MPCIRKIYPESHSERKTVVVVSLSGIAVVRLPSCSHGIIKYHWWHQASAADFVVNWSLAGKHIAILRSCASVQIRSAPSGNASVRHSLLLVVVTTSPDLINWPSREALWSMNFRKTLKKTRALLDFLESWSSLPHVSLSQGAICHSVNSYFISKKFTWGFNVLREYLKINK